MKAFLLSALAATMFAIAGCGDNEIVDGVVEGAKDRVVEEAGDVRIPSTETIEREIREQAAKAGERIQDVSCPLTPRISGDLSLEITCRARIADRNVSVPVRWNPIVGFYIGLPSS